MWLLSIDFAGTIWRWASEPCTPLEGTTPRPHLGGLQVDDLEETFELLQTTPELRTVALSLPWPAPGVAALIADGHDLANATGELSQWSEEDDYDDRTRHIRGRLTEPQYGGVDEPVVCSLEEQPYLDTTLIPESTAVVNPTTWPVSHRSVIGRVYPTVAGLPGHITGRTAISRDIPGSVAPAVSITYGGAPPAPITTTVLLAGHGVLASTVTVFDSAGTSATVTVSQQDDGLGRRCSVADITASGLLLGEPEYGIAWPTAGGRPNVDGGELQEAGQVIAWALAQSGIRVDWHQVRAVLPLLDWLIVVVDIEAQTEPWPWVQDHILPLLPVSALPSGDGLRLILWRYDAQAKDATYELRVEAGVVREDLITYDRDSSQLINECTVRWGMNAVSGEYEESITVTGYPDPDDDRQHGCQAARLSQDALRDDTVGDTGVRSETIEADVICSERAAIQVAMWRVNALSRSRRLVSYYLTHEAPFELGGVLLLTENEAYIDEEVSLVQGRVISDRGDLGVTLLL